jgi:hypothetical protein
MRKNVVDKLWWRMQLWLVHLIRPRVSFDSKEKSAGYPCHRIENYEAAVEHIRNKIDRIKHLAKVAQLKQDGRD